MPPVEQDGLTHYSGDEIESLFARFESEILSLVPYPALPLPPPPSIGTSKSNDGATFAPPRIAQLGPQKSASTRAPARRLGLFTGRQWQHVRQLPSLRPPRPKSGGLGIERKDSRVLLNKSTPRPQSATATLTNHPQASGSQGTASTTTRRTPAKSSAKETPEKPIWR